MVTLWEPGELFLEHYIFEKGFPQERPRINKHTRSIYSPLDNQKAVRKALSQYTEDTIEEQFCLRAHFFYESQRDFTKMDSDNLLKALADSLQAEDVISDDRLMVMCTATKSLCKENWIWLEIRKAEKLSINLEDIKRMQWMLS